LSIVLLIVILDKVVHVSFDSIGLSQKVEEERSVKIILVNELLFLDEVLALQLLSEERA